MAKRISKKGVLDGVEEGRLLLALLKENSEYRRFFEEHRSALCACLSRLPEKDRVAEFRRKTERMTVIGEFVAECEEKFGMAPHAHPLFVRLHRPGPAGKMESSPLSLDEVLMFLDPMRDVETIPRELSLVFYEMFSKPGIYNVVPDDVPPRPLGEAPREIVMPKKIQPYQRLLLVDLRENPALLKKRFAEVLDCICWNRKFSRLQEEWRDLYAGWAPDRSRERRKEAWRHLKVWRLRRQRKSFPDIARKMGITLDLAKKSFYRAYELIEKRSYSPEEFRRDYWEIRKEELKRTCKTCPDRDGCTTLCPDVLPFVDQDMRKRTRELTVGVADVLPHGGRRRTLPTMGRQEDRLR